MHSRQGSGAGKSHIKYLPQPLGVTGVPAKVRGRLGTRLVKQYSQRPSKRTALSGCLTAVISWFCQSILHFKSRFIIARAHSVLLFACRTYRKGHGITGKVITSIPSPGAIKMTDAAHLKSSAKLCKDKFIIHLDPCTWKYNWNEQSINQRYYQCLLRGWKAKYLNTKSQHQSTDYSTEIEHDGMLRGNKTKSSIIKGTFLEAIHLLL